MNDDRSTNGRGPRSGGSGSGGSGSGSGPKSGQGDGSGRRRNRKRRNKGKALTDYWGDKAALPDPTNDIRITQDPTAVVRSLGRPPLPGQEQASDAYFAAVYGRAVGLASALAAAADLIEPEELLGE